MSQNGRRQTEVEVRRMWLAASVVLLVFLTAFVLGYQVFRGS